MKSNLVQYMPETYKNSVVMRNILGAQQEQIEKEVDRQDGVVADMYPSQTIHPELWESEYAIKPEGTIEQRRKNIIAKIRGSGAATLQLIKDIAEAYTNGKADAKENNDDSMIYIEIESEKAGESTINRMNKTMYEIIPAHMDFNCVFKRPISGKIRYAGVVQTTTQRKIGG